MAAIAKKLYMRNAAGTQHTAEIYTTVGDTGANYVNLTVDGTACYVPLVATADAKATIGRVKKGSVEYAIASTGREPYSDKTEFLTAGSYNFTVPAGITKIRALVVGAGSGGGAGTASGGSSQPSGGKGGKGGAVVSAILNVTPGEVIPLTVGAVGSTGAAGGQSSFGTKVIAGGGTTSSRGKSTLALDANDTLICNYSGVDLPTASYKSCKSFEEMSLDSWAYDLTYEDGEANEYGTPGGSGSMSSGYGKGGRGADGRRGSLRDGYDAGNGGFGGGLGGNGGNGGDAYSSDYYVGEAGNGGNSYAVGGNGGNGSETSTATDARLAGKGGKGGNGGTYGGYGGNGGTGGYALTRGGLGGTGGTGGSAGYGGNGGDGGKGGKPTSSGKNAGASSPGASGGKGCVVLFY